MFDFLRGNKGLSLIELLVALVVSSIFIAALYRTFIGQQKTYTVQEQVVDMQQNARVAITRMMKDIRMAGFGNVSSVLPVNSFSQVFTMNASNNITVVGGFKQVYSSAGNPLTVTSTNGNQITLSAATDEFDGVANGYLCIGGLNSYTVTQPTGTTNTLTLDRTPTANPVGSFIFKVQAVTYNLGGDSVLSRDENTGGGAQPLADSIQGIAFAYLDANGNPTAVANDVRMVKVTVTAKTGMADPDYKGAPGGYRTRVIASNINMRNIGLAP
jgi:prepilin-type N-terminal cleavage/methylation domain-containing protein